MTPQDLQLFFVENWPIAAATVFSGIMTVYGFSSLIKGYKTIDVTAAVRLINDGAKIIDVRADSAYDQGHIAGAKNYALDALKSRFDTMDKDAPYLLYCNSGNSASTACAAMKKAGFTNIHNLQMGLGSWRAENFPLVQGVSKVKPTKSTKKHSRQATKSAKGSKDVAQKH